jgi:alkylglycerol monooxygenase
MKLNLLAFAIPFFIALMLLEYYLSKKRGKAYFHFDEAIANINIGIAERLSDVFTTGLFYFVFTWIYQHYAIFNIKPSVLTYLLLFLFTDFIWYWYHRFGHEVNIIWGAHVVHHQSEDFNFTVAARITVLQALVRGVFWSVLPLIGFSPAITSVMLLIHGAYPFFTHTQMIGRLGVLEYFFVTPSHHRVHHSSNPAYLDKNYGDVLIIWDKIFGTFAREEEQPVYGLTKPLESYSFLWQHFHFLLEMGIAFRRESSWRKRMKIIFGKPQHIDPRIRSYLEKKLLKKTALAEPAAILYRYISIQTVITLVSLFFIILFEYYQTGYQLAIAALFVVISVINTGAMLEQKKWNFHLEYLRFFLLGIFMYTFPPFHWVAIFVIMIMLASLIYYKKISERYYGLLYQRAY